VLILGSKTRPKKLTINGSNEKEYDLLVKGGEDLRLDQRVQQVYKIMNKCFTEDPN
jgi:DNA-dependent protein kinase catalytic subunit